MNPIACFVSVGACSLLRKSPNGLNDSGKRISARSASGRHRLDSWDDLLASAFRLSNARGVRVDPPDQAKALLHRISDVYPADLGGGAASRACLRRQRMHAISGGALNGASFDGLHEQCIRPIRPWVKK